MSSVTSATSSDTYSYSLRKNLFSKSDTDDNSIPGTQATAVMLDLSARGGSSGQPGMGPASQLSADAADVFMQLLQQAGAPPSSGGGSGGGSAGDATYDVLDTNKDGVVSEDEFLAAHPEDMPEDQARKLFEALDTQGKGSIDRNQFGAFIQATLPPRLMVPPAADMANGTDDVSGLMELLGSPDGTTA
jgi:hypothetical protein